MTSLHPSSPLSLTIFKKVVGKEESTTLGVYLVGTSPVFIKNGNVAVPISSATPLDISRGPPTYQYSLNFAAASVEVRVYASRLDLTVRTSSNASYPIQTLHGGLCGDWNMYYSRSNGSHVFGPTSATFAGAYGESCMYFPYYKNSEQAETNKRG